MKKSTSIKIIDHVKTLCPSCKIQIIPVVTDPAHLYKNKETFKCFCGAHLTLVNNAYIAK